MPSPYNPGNDAAIDLLNAAGPITQPTASDDSDQIDTEDPAGRGQNRANMVPEWRNVRPRRALGSVSGGGTAPFPYISQLTPGARNIP